MKKHKIMESAEKTVRGFWNSIPILVSIILLISLAEEIVDTETLASYIGDGQIISPVIGATIGSVFAGNPITSYVIAGELKDEGVSLVAITAFILCWVTVGVVQFPAEAILLGRKFAVIRNMIAFVFSLLIAFAVAIIMGIL